MDAEKSRSVWVGHGGHAQPCVTTGDMVWAPDYSWVYPSTGGAGRVEL